MSDVAARRFAFKRLKQIGWGIGAAFGLLVWGDLSLRPDPQNPAPPILHIIIALTIFYMAWQAGLWRIFARPRKTEPHPPSEYVVPAGIAHRLCGGAGDVPDKERLVVITGKCRHCGGNDIAIERKEI